MSRFTVKRSYRQLIAERNAIETQIKTGEHLLRMGPPYEMSLKSTEAWSSKVKSEIESDKALLVEIERDIDIAKDKMGE